MIQESRLLTINGDIVHVLIHSSFYNGKDNTDGIISVVTDITKQKNNEKELIKLNNEKNKLFSIIAHDLRGPLGSASGLSELLNDNFSEYNSDEKKTIISHVHEGISKTYQLLDNLLTWSRSQLGGIELVQENMSVKNILSDSISPLKNAIDNKEISLRVDVDPGITVYADKSTVSTVIRNLLSNSIKFTYRKGTISISSSNIMHENKVKIRVENNGVDIPKEALTKLFRIDENISEPGTENETGTGLGLILCKELIERNGGEIWAESEPGEGAKFTFTLPIS